MNAANRQCLRHWGAARDEKWWMKSAPRLALLLAMSASHAQFPPLPGTPSVPSLLGIPEAERFVDIPRGLVGVMTINATVRGLTLLP